MHCFIYTPDGRFGATFNRDFAQLKFWDLQGDALLWTKTLQKFGLEMSNMRISSDGKYIAFSMRQGLTMSGIYNPNIFIIDSDTQTLSNSSEFLKNILGYPLRLTDGGAKLEYISLNNSYWFLNTIDLNTGVVNKNISRLGDINLYDDLAPCAPKINSDPDHMQLNLVSNHDGIYKISDDGYNQIGHRILIKKFIVEGNTIGLLTNTGDLAIYDIDKNIVNYQKNKNINEINDVEFCQPMGLANAYLAITHDKNKLSLVDKKFDIISSKIIDEQYPLKILCEKLNNISLIYNVEGEYEYKMNTFNIKDDYYFKKTKYIQGDMFSSDDIAKSIFFGKNEVQFAHWYREGNEDIQGASFLRFPEYFKDRGFGEYVITSSRNLEASNIIVGYLQTAIGSNHGPFYDGIIGIWYSGTGEIQKVCEIPFLGSGLSDDTWRKMTSRHSSDSVDLETLEEETDEVGDRTRGYLTMAVKSQKEMFLGDEGGNLFSLIASGDRLRVQWRKNSAHDSSLVQMKYFPNRDWLAVLSEDGVLKLWNAQTGETILNLFILPEQQSPLMEFSRGRII